MVRLLVGLVLLAVAAALLAIAGGIDVRSPGDWQSAAQNWTLPSKDENERSIVLLLGGLVAMLAFVRLITPRSGAARPARE
jgi:hypothetical protein